MNASRLVLVKLGGSLITDKSTPFVSRQIIAHGSGSFGHVVATKYQTAEGIVNDKSLEGLPKVANAAVQIHRIVMECLLKAGLPVVSFAPSSLIMAEERRLASNFIEPILKALEVETHAPSLRSVVGNSAGF